MTNYEKLFVSKVCKALMLMTGVALTKHPIFVLELHEEMFDENDLLKIEEYADKYEWPEEEKGDDQDGKLQMEW